MESTSLQIAYPPALLAIDVPDDRSLRIIVEERTGRRPTDEEELSGSLGVILAGAQEIIRASDDRAFEIAWEVVVCFAVRGDPFPRGGPSSAALVEAATDDMFMQWVKQESHAEPDYVAAMGWGEAGGRVLRHWRISTSEALIDVAALEPPTVREIASP